MQKVLIIGSEFFDYHKSVERAFKKLGKETRLIGVNYVYQSFSERLEYYRNKDKYFARKKQDLNDEVLRVYEEFKPDLVFTIQVGYLFRETLLKMKDAVKTVWMMDTIKRNKLDFRVWDLFDHIFFFEKTDVEVLWETERLHGNFLPLALDETVYYPMEGKKDIDILFVGALYDDRVQVLKRICHDFPEHNVQIYGIKNVAFFQRLYFRIFREYKKSFRNKNIPPAEVNKLYSRSRICINMHHPQNIHGVNQRFFEVPGSHSFQLVNTNDFISSNFSPEEIMMYKSYDDLIEKLHLLLKGEVDMESMTERAYQKIISQHTFTHRMKHVLEIASGKTAPAAL